MSVGVQGLCMGCARVLCCVSGCCEGPRACVKCSMCLDGECQGEADLWCVSVLFCLSVLGRVLSRVCFWVLCT